MGVGPFKFKEWTTGEHIVLERNPAFNWGPEHTRGGPTYLETLEFRFIPEYATRLAALEAELSERPETAGVLLATAHPAKFAEVVEPVMGRPVPVPPQLSRCLEGKRMVVPMAPRLEALMDLL